MESLINARRDLLHATDLISECRNQSGLSNTTVVILDQARRTLLSVQREMNLAIEAPDSSAPAIGAVTRYRETFLKSSNGFQKV